MTTVSVDLGPRSYDIVIGENLLPKAGDYLAPHLKAKRVAIVTDENVYGLHGKTLEAALSNYETHMIIRPAGENQKSFDGLQAVLNALFKAGFDRNDTVVAFGGGVIGDLTGFAASVFKRGCQFIQIPTTLLSQVDSSVGGKTAINNKYGKNLIGAFYQPKLVLADTSVLKTLPERELKAGYAEVVKYGLLGDSGFFNWLDGNGQDVLDLKTEAGHTFAHALEIEAGYSGDLLHGEAVSAGMEMAFDFSAAQGLCGAKDAAKVKAHFKMLGLTSINDITPLLKDPGTLLAHMDQDKKNEGGALTLILARAIGEAFVQKAAPREAVLNYLTQLSQTASPYACRRKRR